MMVWTIEASLKSKYINRTFVSTEDAEIKEIALAAGAEVIDRPEEFTGEGTMAMIMTVNQFMHHLWKENYQPDIYVHLYATNPLRTEKHIDEAIELHRKSKENFLMGVCPAPDTHRFLQYIDSKTGLLEFYYHPIKYGAPCQYEELYCNNGAISIGYFPLSASAYCVGNISHALPYVMTEEDAFDVDTPIDFKVAEMLLEERLRGEGGT